VYDGLMTNRHARGRGSPWVAPCQDRTDRTDRSDRSDRAPGRLWDNLAAGSSFDEQAPITASEPRMRTVLEKSGDPTED